MTTDLPQDVELRLLVEKGDLPQLRRHRRLRETAVARATTHRQHSVYYDTRTLDLIRRGVTLRIRRVGRRFVQTLRLPPRGDGGLLDRRELETDLQGPQPDPARIPDPGLRTLVAQACSAPDFGPILETDVQRSSRRLELDGTVVRLDLDQGEIRSPRGNAPVCELALELESGDAEQLYGLAAELQRTVRLRIATRTKLERGVELLTGAHPTPQRASRLQLPADATVEQAMERAFRSCLDQILANEEPAQRGVDPEGVHQMRVGVRRLRSAMALFGDLLPAEQTAPLREELRWLGSELGRARDLDVFIDESLGPLRRRFPEDPALKRLDEEATQMRAEAHLRLGAALDSLRYAELALRMGHWIAGREWRRQPTSPTSARLFLPARDAARKLLQKRYKRVRRRGRRLAAQSESDLHAMRIDAKKLRYAAEFLSGLFPKSKAMGFIRRISRLQDSLGHLNDAATARQLLERILERLDGEARPPLLRAAGFVEGWISRTADEELAALPKRWKSLSGRPRFWRAGR